jgi:hypothetical protein
VNVQDSKNNLVQNVKVIHVIRHWSGIFMQMLVTFRHPH